jgi:ubiquinone/menaquinone biosynthesis C-methylase UbiE
MRGPLFWNSEAGDCEQLHNLSGPFSIELRSSYVTLKNFINYGDIVLTLEKFRGKRALIILDKLLNIFNQSNRIEGKWTAVQFKDAVHWGGIPYVQKRMNFHISGNENKSFGQHIVDSYLANRPHGTIGLTLGCGTGYREIQLAESAFFSKIDAYDISENALAEGRRAAKEKNLHNIINFERKDLSRLDLPENHYDFILVEQSLHHFVSLDRLMQKINKTLKRDGVFIINEFVGPDKFQWTDRQLEIANDLLSLMPNKYKIQHYDKKVRRKIYRPGLLRMRIYDPSEAVESSRIVPLASQIFDIIEDRNYGGTILQILFQDIANNFLNDETETSELLEIICNLEDWLIRTKEIESDYKYMACKKKS